MKMNRRKFLQLTSAALASSVVAVTGYVAWGDEADSPVVERVQIPIKALPAALEGFTIAVLADFHLYPLTQLDLIQRAVELANAQNPDLTVLLGDYVWHEVEGIFDLAPALAKLNAKYGLFTILGNHDIWTDVNIIKTGLGESQLPVLRNQGIALDVGNAQLYLAGLDDVWSGQPDLPATLNNRPADAPVILLSHEPDPADDFSLDGRIALQLSGHSHGGQIRLPFVGAPVLPYMARKYDMGLYRVNDMWLYTNRGLGVTNEPVRLNCAPEITLVTLVRV